jgi:adenine-specific DNA-methyltransferase
LNSYKQKLELTWIGKENRPRLEPRILLEDPEKSYRAPTPIPSLEGNKKGWVCDKDIFDNRLIFGDNLLALKALEQEFAGKIKCIYIDPPYNTGSAFTHYDDGLEHSIWLSLMRDRLELLRMLLSDEGSIWISIDDNEAHYLKVLCDEVFGRSNFVANVIWQKMFSPKSTARHLSDMHDHILLFAKDKAKWTRNLLPRNAGHDKSYKNPDNDPRGPWTSGDLSARNYYSAGTYPITTPAGRVIAGPPKGMYWRVSKVKFEDMNRDNRIWWGKDGDNQPRIKRFLSEVMEGVVPQTIWFHQDVGNTQEAKKEVIAVVPEVPDVFQTTKPERLLKRIIELASAPGDWVLDSFAGSGPTGAVAHKMGRRWIMVELGEHCHTYIIPRMKKVINGEDPGGVTKAVNWQGGGGFRYFSLAPSLLEKDKWGNWVISKDYNATMLASAMAKHEGFVYNPDETFYWKQGKSTEKDYIFTTTNFITVEYLDSIHEEMQPDESLLICCKSFQEACENRYENITVRKIPNMLLGRCEFGKEDYSLNIAEGPSVTDGDAFESTPVAETPARKEEKKSAPRGQPGLFDKKGENDDE